MVAGKSLFGYLAAVYMLRSIIFILIKKSNNDDLKTKLFDNFNEIIDKRLYKILKIMTINKNNLKNFEERFSKEEKFLHHGLQQFFDAWKHKVTES